MIVSRSASSSEKRKKSHKSGTFHSDQKKFWFEELRSFSFYLGHEEESIWGVEGWKGGGSVCLWGGASGIVAC